MSAALHYIINLSVDGFIEDADGDFQWSEPDPEQFAFITDLVRPLGTQLLGRRMYEMMAVWETDPTLAAGSEREAEFARAWCATEKVVYSTSLDAVWTERTRLERRFEPDAVRAMKEAAAHDLSIAGPELAAHAFRAGLVDELHLFVGQLAVGRGKPALPTDVRLDLELLDERRFPGGNVYLRHRVRTA